MVYRSEKDWNIRGKLLKSNQKPEGWTKCSIPLYSSHQVKDSNEKVSVVRKIIHKVIR